MERKLFFAEPVACLGHPDRYSRNGCRLAAQDARAEADRHRRWVRTDGSAFRIVEAAFRTDQQGSGAFGVAKGIGSCFAGTADYICVGVSTGAVCLVPVPNPAEQPVVFGDSLLSPT